MTSSINELTNTNTQHPDKRVGKSPETRYSQEKKNNNSIDFTQEEIFIYLNRRVLGGVSPMTYQQQPDSKPLIYQAIEQ